MKRTVYLDTTIPSYLYDRRDSISAFVEVTNRWWDEERQNFHLVISEATITELSEGQYAHKDKVLSECVPQIELLPPAKEVESIAEIYMENYLMPRKLAGDAFHLAYASFYRADFLMTWNCDHLANANKKQHIRILNTRLNLYVPEIVTPLELFTETEP